MNQIKFVDFTYEQTQTILKVANEAGERCVIKIHGKSEYWFFNDYHLLLDVVDARISLWEKTGGGLMSQVPKKNIIQAVEFGEEDVKELLTEAPTELWVFINEDHYDKNLSFAERTKYPEIFTAYWGAFKEYRPADVVIFENRNKFVEKYFIKKSCGHIYKHHEFFNLIFERVKNEGVNIDHNEYYDTGYSIIGVNSHHCDERQQEVWKKYGFQLVDPIYSSGQSTFIYERFYKSLAFQKQMQEAWKDKNNKKFNKKSI